MRRKSDTGGINNYLLENDGKVLDLESGTIVAEGLDALVPEYDDYLERAQCFLEGRSTERQETITRANVNVTNYLSSLSHMQHMQYYSGHQNHCTPTAATNLVMYWKYGRGFLEWGEKVILVVEWPYG